MHEIVKGRRHNVAVQLKRTENAHLQLQSRVVKFCRMALDLEEHFLISACCCQSLIVGRTGIQIRIVISPQFGLLLCGYR